VHESTKELSRLLDESKDGTINHAESPLIVAALLGQLTIVQQLLKEGNGHINKISPTGNTPLLAASFNGQLATVQWLLSAGGASIDERDNAGSTALLLASAYGRLATVQWLLSAGGASIDEKDNAGGWTALLCASANGHLATVQWLLGKGGASIDEKHNGGWTALLVASANGHLATVQWLLRGGGASIDEKENAGRTALSLAVENEHQEILACLLENGAKMDDEMLAGNVLIEDFLKGNHLASFEYSELHRAAYYGDLTQLDEMVRVKQYDIRQKTKYGTDPLFIAAREGERQADKPNNNHLACVFMLICKLNNYEIIDACRELNTKTNYVKKTGQLGYQSLKSVTDLLKEILKTFQELMIEKKLYAFDDHHCPDDIKARILLWQIKQTYEDIHPWLTNEVLECYIFGLATHFVANIKTSVFRIQEGRQAIVNTLLKGDASQAFYWLDKLLKGDHSKIPSLMHQILSEEQKQSGQVNKTLSNVYAITEKYKTCPYPTIAKLVISCSAIFRLPITRELEGTSAYETSVIVHQK